jgi:large subunit ribosomal protein L9
VAQATSLKKTRALREAADRDSARVIAATLAETPLVIVAKAGTSGKLFGSVTASDIVEAIERQFHVVVDRKHVEIERPIRDVGRHVANVALYADVSGTITIDVQAG